MRNRGEPHTWTTGSNGDVETRYVVVYPAPDGWRWRLRGGNHETISTGESHQYPSGAVHAAERAVPAGIPVYLAEGLQ